MTIVQKAIKDSVPSSLIVILFSMNRALQLDASLRSFYRHCWDAGNFDLFIIYKTTNRIHSQQYQELIREYKQYVRIHYLQEARFRIDLLRLLFDNAFIDKRTRFFKIAVHFGGILGRITRRWVKPTPFKYVLFLVDDNIFVGNFYLRDILYALGANPDALGFSLRLGENTNYCYMHDQLQELPHFHQAAPGVLKFDWTKAEHDFHYPLEVSSSIYRLLDVLPLINSRSFSNPNELESKIAASASLFQHNLPWLLCFDNSVTFCNPVNRVQNRESNRMGNTYNYPVGLLADKFDVGYRIDVASFDGFITIGCHQEAEIKFIRHES